MTHELQTMPVKIMRAEDFRKIADYIILTTKRGGYVISEERDNRIDSLTIKVQERWEHYIHQPLKKGDFVVSDNPAALIDPEGYYDVDYTIKQNGERIFGCCSILGKDLTEPQVISVAQSALIFEEFEKGNSANSVMCDSVEIWFSNAGTWVSSRIDGNLDAHIDTPFDLIYHISKYNETASTKIPLTFTEAFVKKVIQ